MKPRRSWMIGRWWPMLLAPLAVWMVYLTRDFAMGRTLRALDSSLIPVTTIGLAAAACLLSAWRRRGALMWLVMAMAILFFLREAHPPGDPTGHLPGAKKGVYVGIAAVGVWAFFWRRRVREELADPVILIWLIAIGWTYAASQLLLARGALKIITEIHNQQGQRLRTPMEETCETLAHAMLLTLALIALFRRPRGVGSKPSIPEPESKN